MCRTILLVLMARFIVWFVYLQRSLLLKYSQKATKSYASFGDLKGATRKTLAFCSTDRPSAGRPAKIGMTALQPEGLVLTGGAANDTREQPCMQPHPHGVEPSQCKQQPEMDPLGLTKDAQQQVLLHLHPLAARGASC